jgi:hypothetical protein
MLTYAAACATRDLCACMEHIELVQHAETDRACTDRASATCGKALLAMRPRIRCVKTQAYAHVHVGYGLRHEACGLGHGAPIVYKP